MYLYLKIGASSRSTWRTRRRRVPLDLRKHRRVVQNRISGQLGTLGALGWSVWACSEPLGPPEMLPGLDSETQVRSKVLLGSARSPKCARKCCSGLLRSCLSLPNAAQACSGAACALRKAARARSKDARSLEKLVRASSAAAFVRKNFSSHLSFGMRLQVLLEIVVRTFCSEITVRMCCSKLLFEVTCLCNAVLMPTSHSSSCKVHGMHRITLV